MHLVERRCHPRLTLHLPPPVLVMKGGVRITGAVLDISLGGACLSVKNAAYEPGEVLCGGMLLYENKRIEFVGEVVSKRADLLGIRFSNVDSRDLLQLTDRYLDGGIIGLATQITVEASALLVRGLYDEKTGRRVDAFLKQCRFSHVDLSGVHVMDAGGALRAIHSCCEHDIQLRNCSPQVREMMEEIGYCNMRCGYCGRSGNAFHTMPTVNAAGIHAVNCTSQPLRR